MPTRSYMALRSSPVILGGVVGLLLLEGLASGVGGPGFLLELDALVILLSGPTGVQEGQL